MTQKYSNEETISRIKNWCDRQERCHYEVKQKLASWGVYYDQADQILVQLIEENYLNELRFSKAFVSGKFRIKKWGRIKIKQALKFKQISNYCIQEGLKEIDSHEYNRTIQHLIERKKIDYSGLSNFDSNGKIAQFLLNKGYEKDLVWSLLLEKDN